ncbi:MAG TPA: TadE family protein [Pirellulales bacterium]|nr:TadE family protein [Pirellulales bacterium]
MSRTRHWRKRRGATLVETALVLPMFFLFLLGIFEYGQYEMVRQVVENAARAGARYAVVNSADASTSQVQQVVSQQLNNMPMFNSPTIQVFKADPTSGANIGAWTAAKFGDCIGVQVHGTYQPVTAQLLKLPASLPFQTEAMMTCEAN